MPYLRGRTETAATANSLRLPSKPAPVVYDDVELGEENPSPLAGDLIKLAKGQDDPTFDDINEAPPLGVVATDVIEEILDRLRRSWSSSIVDYRDTDAVKAETKRESTESTEEDENEAREDSKLETLDDPVPYVSEADGPGAAADNSRNTKWKFRSGSRSRIPPSSGSFIVFGLRGELPYIDLGIQNFSEGWRKSSTAWSSTRSSTAVSAT